MSEPTTTESLPKTAVTYMCGECEYETIIHPGDSIYCRACGHRILYKLRTKRVTVFDAR
ncbi:DNA-directed RNA polymerases II, IV and V subunit 12-like [Teleopsis dalmanni]|uniref:DNA-directed RNA polymerases II, IV and V subunit 12-like n=1 Tax=Teleopsis dalmanni TaxID=139649 RepID=UPI0018CE4C28|nr:DNA-directed RNA polymerases II, IV and V subunit 12-like [Teleopsis dalmanni]